MEIVKMVFMISLFLTLIAIYILSVYKLYLSHCKKEKYMVYGKELELTITEYKAIMKFVDLCPKNEEEK